MPSAPPSLAKDELFARLADGHAAQTTVVTPNRRLALALARDFDRRQLAAGRSAWETPDILPYAAFVERLYEDARYSEQAADLPLALTPDQEQALWESIVRAGASELLNVPDTAAAAQAAWRLAHEWHLLDALRATHLNDDAKAFAAWAREYASRTERGRLIDRARLPAAVAGVLHRALVKQPRHLVAYGFDGATPQQRSFFDALGAQGVPLVDCDPMRRETTPQRIVADDARDEIGRAARWARVRLEANGDARIAIVVPDLAQRKSALRRALREMLIPGDGDALAPFNVSLGEPLANYPLVAHALAALELGGPEIDFERASLVMRSPFIGEAESEHASRARLDARLRRDAERFITLDRLARSIGSGIAPGLAKRLAAYAEFRRARLFGMQAPGEWALALLGFPGERALDSTEYQTLKKWHEALARFAGLDRVAPRIKFSEAVARLRRIAASTLFQPESPDVPIQVLGVLEAAGMEFDHLWVMGLSDQAWPPPARANPFIPLHAQRAAGVPAASPAATLEYARRLTAGWLGCAGEVVLSHPRRAGDRALAPSPLIAQVAEVALELPQYDTWRSAIHRSGILERIADARAPALPADAVPRGGAGVLKDQSACPFRAFARRRLAAKEIDAPHTGLDARERGTLVHAMLATVWREIKCKQALEAMSGAALEALLGRAAEQALAEIEAKRPTTAAGRFAAVERARLVRLGRDWLEYERGRADFSVAATEDSRAVEIGRLKLNLRLDRIDETAAGERVVIDYKASEPKLAMLLGERPDEPQLPLYLTACEPDAAAAAFAQVRTGGMKFVGLAQHGNVLPDVSPPEEVNRRSRAEANWSEQVTAWRTTLGRLADEFAAGLAWVDPKNRLQTCRECDLQPLCRIHERMADADEEDEA